MTEISRPLAVGIDKLRIGIDTTGRKLDIVKEVCADLVKAKTARTLRSTGQTHSHRYSITVHNGHTMLVEFVPHVREGGHPLFVLELNPNKLGRKGLAEARVILKQFFEEAYDKVMGSAFVTLIDYFADYPVPPQDVFIDMTRKEVCAVWGIQFDGQWKLQTLYFGAGGTDGQVRAYDTQDQAAAALARSGRDGTLEEALSADGKVAGCRMRVEARRYPKSVPLRELHKLENPFARVAIAKIDADAPEFQDPLGRLLLTAASAVGWKLALHRLGEKTLIRKYRRAFAKYHCEWWNPDAAAVDVAVAVLRTGLFPESAFDTKVARRARVAKDGPPTFDRKEFERQRREQRKSRAALTSTKRVSSDFDDYFADLYEEEAA